MKAIKEQALWPILLLGVWVGGGLANLSVALACTMLLVGVGLSLAVVLSDVKDDVRAEMRYRYRKHPVRRWVARLFTGGYIVWAASLDYVFAAFCMVILWTASMFLLHTARQETPRP